MICVICWKYSDGSGYGVVRAYESEELAKKDITMLRQHSDLKQFELFAAEIIRLGEKSEYN